MKNLSTEQFEDAVSEGVTLVDFYADWCGPCKVLLPLLEDLSVDYEGKAEFYKVNSDQSPELMQRFGIRGVPTIIIFKDGKPVDTTVGMKPKGEFAAKIDDLL